MPFLHFITMGQYRYDRKWSGRERGGMGSGKVLEQGFELGTPVAQWCYTSAIGTDWNIKPHNCFQQWYTLVKTGVMAAENSILPSQEKFYIYSNRKKIFLVVIILEYYCFYCIFDPINATLVSRRDFFKNMQKCKPTPNIWTIMYILNILKRCITI